MLKSIKFRTWLNMMSAMGIILIIMWLLQVVFLQNFYELVKGWDAKKVQEELVSVLSEDHDIRENYDEIIDLSRENDMYIEVYNEEGKLLISPMTHFFGNRDFRRPYFTMNNFYESYAVSEVLNEMSRAGEESKIIKIERENTEQASMVLINLFECSGDDYYVVSRTSLIPVQATAEIISSLILYIFIAMLILSLVMSFIFASSITKPTRALSVAANQVAEGNYNVKINHSGKDEMGRLVNDFNNMTAELSKADSIRKDLIANVSHELRTPLTMIKGYAETLRDLTIDNPEKREKQLNIIVDESDRLSELITNMLDLSKLQAGKTELNIEEINLSDMVKRLVKRYDIFKDQGYEINVSIAEGVCIKGDWAKIEQVMCNLIDNAINHSNEKKTVDIRLGINGTFEVRNYGDVIKSENLKHIWDRYYRINKSGERRITGTGIGLSIVKEILDLHKFSYSVTSEETQGTVFTVKFKK